MPIYLNTFTNWKCIRRSCIISPITLFFLKFKIQGVMKKVILFFFIIFIMNSLVIAQITVYKGTSTYSSDVICTVKDGNVYKKTSSYSSDILRHVSKKQVYKGNSNYISDVIYNIIDGKVYKESSSYTSDRIHHPWESYHWWVCSRLVRS